MAANEFSAKDICDIIKVSNKSGVKELKLGDLCVSFTVSNQQVEDNQGLDVAPHRHDIPLSSLPNTYPEAPEPVLVTDDQREFMRIAQDSQTLIEDPLAHEQAIIDSYGTGVSERSVDA